MYVTACDLEKSFSFDKTAKITNEICANEICVPTDSCVNITWLTADAATVQDNDQCSVQSSSIWCMYFTDAVNIVILKSEMIPKF